MKFWHVVAALVFSGLVYLVTETLYRKHLEKYIP